MMSPDRLEPRASDLFFLDFCDGKGSKKMSTFFLHPDLDFVHTCTHRDQFPTSGLTDLAGVSFPETYKINIIRNHNKSSEYLKRGKRFLSKKKGGLLSVRPG